jgi:hypothetical protein
LSRYVQGDTPVENPADSERGADDRRRANTIHVAARAPERPEHEDGIHEYDHERCRHHRFLARHPQRARRHRNRLPQQTSRRLVSALARVDGGQEEQRHHRLGALHHIVDDFAVERVNGPEQGHGEGDRRRPQPQSLWYAASREHPARHAVQEDRARGVDQEVDEVKAADVGSAQRFVERQR